MTDDIITAINSLPDDKGLIIYCAGVKVLLGADGFVAIDLTTDDLKSLTAEVVALRAKVAEYEAMLKEAIEEIADWGAYASEYFQEKHDLKGTIEKFRAALEGETRDERGEAS